MSLSRQQRRAAEHQARKAARKEGYSNSAVQAPAAQPTETPSIPEDLYTVEGTAAYQKRIVAEHSARREANRANAQHSTGPRTEVGKATSSQNSFKHGIYSKQLVLPDENPQALEHIKASFLEEHQPATMTEFVLVTEMAEHLWRLERFRRIECNLLKNEALSIPQMTAVQRFMNSAERGFYRALKTLREMQKERGFVPQPQPAKKQAVKSAVADSGFVPPNTAAAPSHTAQKPAKMATHTAAAPDSAIERRWDKQSS